MAKIIGVVAHGIFDSPDEKVLDHCKFNANYSQQIALAGGIPMDIPDFRDPAVREQYRNDTQCTDPACAADQLIPSYSRGNPQIDQSVYDYLAAIPLNEENNSAYRKKLQAAKDKEREV